MYSLRPSAPLRTTALVGAALAAVAVAAPGTAHAQSAGVGSVPLSVASSGLLPGSVYTNPSGSIGSGTIGLGSVSVPEAAIGILGVNFAGGYLTAVGERQAEGDLAPGEITAMHNSVVGSSQAGTVVEDAARSANVALPEPVAGSIESVHRAAAEDPFEASERINRERVTERERAAATPRGEVDGGMIGLRPGS